MIDLFREEDCSAFLHLASNEGWLCDQWELSFLLRTNPNGCVVWRVDGTVLGFVTTIKYGASGWIGNLLVAPEGRGKGIGSRLMGRAVALLEQKGLQTIWLTASPEGQPIYGKLGFTGIDTIFRWRGNPVPGVCKPSTPDVCMANSIDSNGWGDERANLITSLTSVGTLFTSRDSFIVQLPYAGGLQLGPWGSSTAAGAATVLDYALKIPANKDSLFMDVPERNQAAANLLVKRGFHTTGSTRLMYRGKEPKYQPELVYALASMGSFG